MKKNKLSKYSESKHSKDKCMECEKSPIYEVLWAEGMGHAWFCEKCFKEWAFNGDGRGGINSVKLIKDGRASDKWKEAKGRNIWYELKDKFQEAIQFKVEDYEPEVLEKLSDTDLISLHGKLHRIFKERGEKEGDELVINAHAFVLAELKKRGLEHRPEEKIDQLTYKKPSKESEDKPVKLEDVKRFWDTDFYLKDLFLAGVGGTFVNGEGNDLDIWTNWESSNCPHCQRLLQQLSFRLKSFLPDNLSEKLHLVPEPEGKFTNYMPLAKLKVEFIKPEEREVLRMSLQEQEPRAADPEVKKMYKDSIKEDKIKLFRFFLPQKPTRAAKPNRRMTQDFYVSLWKDEQFPVFSSKKYDGMAIEIHSDGERVKIWSEDGEEITNRLPKTVEAIKKLDSKSVILLAELEKWDGAKHLPRETTSGYVHEKGEADDSDLISNIFTCVYYDGKDLHNETEEVRQDTLHKLGIPQSTWSVPDLKLKLNKVPNLISKNRKELEDNVKIVSEKVASEGDVGKSRGAKFFLDGKSRDGWIKFHKNAVLFGKVIKRNVTKVATVFNYTYGIDKGKYNIKEKEISDGLVEVGKSFNTDVKLNEGDMLAIEFETFNFVKDERDDTVKVSAWAPRFIPLENVEMKVPDKIDDIDSVVRKAKANGVFQEKVITPEGITLYESDIIEDESLVPLRESFEDKYPDLKEEFLYEQEKPPEEICRVTEAKRPLKQYPKNYGILVSHFRGKSAHLDFRRKQNGWLEGETILNQPKGLITEPVETIADGKKWNSVLLRKGKFTPDMNPQKKAVIVPKAKQPLEWLNVREVSLEPGQVGATRFEPGVFITMDEGTVYPGTQKPYFKEFFLDMKHFKGRMVERILAIGKEWEKPPKGASIQWQGWTNLVEQIPYLLTRRGRVRHEDTPPDGVSWLSPEWEKKIKPEFQWWKGSPSKQQKLKMMDNAYNDLIEREILKGHLLKEEDLQEVKGKFALRWLWWMGAKVVRGMPAKGSHYDLLLDIKKDGIDYLKMNKNPLTEEKTVGVRKVMNINTPLGENKSKWLEFEGSIAPKDSTLKQVTVVKEFEPRRYIVKDSKGNEIETKETFAKFKAGQTAWIDQWENLYTGTGKGEAYGNPNERIPVYSEIIDSGDMEWIEDSKDFASFKFNGRKLKGSWIMKTETPGTNFWIFSKGSLPGQKFEESTVTLTSGELINLSTIQIGEEVDITFRGKTYSIFPTYQCNLRMDTKTNS